MFHIHRHLGFVALVGVLALAGCGDTPTDPTAAGQVQGTVPAGDHASLPASSSVVDDGDLAITAHIDAPFALGKRDLALMRSGTAHYHRIERALADGFVDPSEELECIAHPELGGMGVHFINFERYFDLEIDPSHPEILLYEPDGRGGLKLVAVEFAVNAADWHALHGEDVMPQVAGVTYDPPNPDADNPIVQTSYTLHAWVWKNNPSGMFFPFNPRVGCR
jgi:hypothetical protein